jgi:hypothetical protein
MPYVRTTDFNPTDVAVAADVQFELDAARAYVRNGIVDADVDDGAVQTSRIYKPESYGFPRRTTIGTFNEGAGRHVGPHDRSAAFGTFLTLGADPWKPWLYMVDRTSIFTDALGQDASVPVPGMMDRKYIEGPCAVEVTAAWSYAAMYDDTAGGAPVYPGTGGFPAGDFAGAFILAYQSIDPLTPVVTLGATRRKIYPNLDGFGIQTRSRGDHAVGDVVVLTTAGVYDFWLEYQRFGADRTQVSVGARNFVVEVYK